MYILGEWNHKILGIKKALPEREELYYNILS